MKNVLVLEIPEGIDFDVVVPLVVDAVRPFGWSQESTIHIAIDEVAEEVLNIFKKE